MPSFLNPIFILALLVALTVHEWAHAFTASRLGDPTPEEQGRLTLNPIAHLDPLGALMFFFVGFGWAKPVPVNPAYFRHPKRDMLLTAAAGPFSNLVLAFGFFLVIHFLSGSNPGSVWGMLGSTAEGPITQVFLLQLSVYSLFVNLGLMAFNLIPIAPLDGSKVVEAFVPYNYELQYESFQRNGPFILLGVLIAERVLGLPLISTWITWIMDAVLRVFALAVGG